MNSIRLNVTSTESNQRLDKYISENAECLTRTAAARLIEAGNCTVNGVVQKAKNYLLKSGDEVAVEKPEAVPLDIIPEELAVEIVHEDEDLLVVNKPRGMVVHPAHGNHSGTLVNFLMHHCGDSLSGINGEIRPGIVHRLDKNTSGLLLIAKNDFAHNGLSAQLKNRDVKREYRAVVSGVVKQNGRIDVSIGRHKIKRKEMCAGGVNPREAATNYEIIKHFEGASYMKIRLETGRTHQIRVHFAYIGHPVLGDDVYGNGKPKWLGGQCLHAIKVGFTHPRNAQYMEFESELPDYFVKLLGQLRGLSN
ncbi:MAG: RluA family pseudouridine synthase [Oscillospiraceae bacterium]|nr:RluA family pseudouridine synthase [Oscillospiraceae bacterium]